MENSNNSIKDIEKINQKYGVINTINVKNKDALEETLNKSIDQYKIEGILYFEDNKLIQNVCSSRNIKCY